MTFDLDYSTFVILPNARNARPGMFHLQRNGGIARKTSSGEDHFPNGQAIESFADETSVHREHSYRTGSSQRRASSSSQSGLSADAPSFVPSRERRRSPRNSRNFSIGRSRSPSLPVNYYSPPERSYSPPQRAYSPAEQHQRAYSPQEQRAYSPPQRAYSPQEQRAYSPPQRTSSTISGFRPYLPPHRRGSVASYSSHPSSRSSSYSPHSRRK